MNFICENVSQTVDCLLIYFSPFTELQKYSTFLVSLYNISVYYTNKYFLKIASGTCRKNTNAYEKVKGISIYGN